MQIVRRFVPRRLVFGIHLVAECRRFRIEGRKQQVWPVMLDNRMKVPEKTEQAGNILPRRIRKRPADKGKVAAEN